MFQDKVSFVPGKKVDLQIDESEIKFQASNWTKRRKCALLVATLVLVALAVGIAAALTLSKRGLSGRDQARNTLVLISLDGLRYDYISKGVTPNLQKMALGGVKASFLRSSYPTLTFPTHYTIVTGLHAESHGIVSNTFLDKQSNKVFRLGQASSFEGTWWGGEPIWVTAIKHGLKSASFFWVGSEAAVQGIRPTYWKVFNKSISFEDRVRQVLDWIKMDEGIRPDVITLYFEEPDQTGHNSGANSAEVYEALRNVDHAIGQLLQGLKEGGLEERVNVIALGDHGLTDVSCDRVIYLDQYINTSQYFIAGAGAFSMIYTSNVEQTENVYANLSCAHENLKVYRKDQGMIPKRLHFQNSRMIGDIVLAPDPEYVVLIKSGSCNSELQATHGFDNAFIDMQTFFISKGPDFKRGYETEGFTSTEIYNLMADLLHIKPAPNNGTHGSLRHMLAQSTLAALGDFGNSSANISFVDVKFPLDFAAALKGCSRCVCSYCGLNSTADINKAHQSLNLSLDDASTSRSTHFPWGLPVGEANNHTVMLTQRHYVTSYSTTLHLPLWVGYRLRKEQSIVNGSRVDCFRKDIRLEDSKQAYCSDYRGSGYDRGHMAPSADFNFDLFAQQDSNVLTNIVPQHAAFNRRGGLWYALERMTRDIARKYGSVYVTSGVVFDYDHDGVGDAASTSKRWLHNSTGSVAIPSHFYRILMRCESGQFPDALNSFCEGALKILAFVVPHHEVQLCSLQAVNDTVKTYTATVNDIERLTGLTFFARLNRTTQARLKMQLSTDLWL